MLYDGKVRFSYYDLSASSATRYSLEADAPPKASAKRERGDGGDERRDDAAGLAPPGAKRAREAATSGRKSKSLEPVSDAFVGRRIRVLRDGTTWQYGTVTHVSKFETNQAGSHHKHGVLFDGNKGCTLLTLDGPQPDVTYRLLDYVSSLPRARVPAEAPPPPGTEHVGKRVAVSNGVHGKRVSPRCFSPFSREALPGDLSLESPRGVQNSQESVPTRCILWDGEIILKSRGLEEEEWTPVVLL